MEPLHPLFQSTVISVYMLDVVRANHTLALTIAHDLMGHLLKLAYTPAPSLHNTASDETRGVKTAITVSAFIFSN